MYAPEEDCQRRQGKDGQKPAAAKSPGRRRTNHELNKLQFQADFDSL